MMHRLLFLFLYLCLAHSLFASSLLFKPSEEGFYAGTLVKTQYGYELIENIAIGDTVIDADGNPTKVIAITHRLVDTYAQLHLHNIIVSVGSDQHLYYSSSSSWIKACDMPCNKKYVAELTIIHALTTDSHTLVVTPQDIIVHNAAAMLCGMPSICCGYIAIANPIIATLGGVTLSLAVIAYTAYQSHIKQHGEDQYNSVQMPDFVVLAERFYYEQRKGELEQLKQELFSIKNDLLIIKGLYASGITHQLLSRNIYETVNKNQLLSIAQEKKLSEVQKNRLRELRTNELESLEKHICDIQLLLALHVHQVIENVEYAQKSYDSHIGEIQKAADSWNDNRERMTVEAARRIYQYALLREHLISLMRQSCNELLLIAEYYRACTSKCIESSTTIIATLEHLAPIVAETRQLLLEESKIAHNNSATIERYCERNHVSIMTIKQQAQKEFDLQYKQRDAEVLKKIAQQQQQICSGFAGGPQKDDDENDEQKNSSQEIKISQDDAPHMFGNRPGHLIDTPENRKLLIELTSNKKNFLGLDSYGNEWYAKMMRDGKQLWTTVRNNVIRNGGLNSTPRGFNPKTGLCNPTKSFK